MEEKVGNRKDKHIGIRLLVSVSAFLLIGSIVYIWIAGFSLYSSALLVSAVLGLGVPSVMAGEGILEIIVGFFEMFLDGIMEVVGGIFEVIGSIFG